MRFPLLPLCFLSALVSGCLLLADGIAKTQPMARKELRAGEPSEADLTRAREILGKWETEAPEKSPRLMRIVYWSPVDREPQPEFRPRLTRVLKSIQDFYGREMASWGFPGCSIQLDLEPDGMLKIYEVKGLLKSEECSETDGKDGQEIRRDCLKVLAKAGLNGEKETMVIFCNLADWDPEKRTMGHHSPYYASGNSQGGTAWQVDSPLLDSASLAVKDQMLTDRQYGHISLGKYNSIFVGGVCHELGHALGLPHCKEVPADRKARGTALMGSGNRTFGDELRGDGKGSFLTLAHALKLAAHPQFSGSTKQIEAKAEVSFSNWKLEPNVDGLRVTGRLESKLPVHAVLAYADPAGGGDYDSEIAAAIPHADGSFAIQLPRPEKKRTTAALNFVAVCANGAATASVWSSQALTMNAKINDDSSYDVSKAIEKLALDQCLPAFREGKLSEADLAKLPISLQALYKRLRAPDSATGKPTPATVPAATKQLPLSDAAPGTATTGWAGPHYDRTADGNPLVGPDGLLAHGLYAHADSVYEYDLGGQWESFTGSGCLLQDGYGAVEASIVGDGKALWNSGALKEGMGENFKVDVTGIKTLRLEIKGIKGKNGAWGAWGEPLLER